jgi:RNA polymerase sigma factor (sigma-70 family)
MECGRTLLARPGATGPVVRPPTADRLSRLPDEKLVEQCLENDSHAWSELIDRYKNLIYSIPVRMGLRQEANDIFQSVCLDLLRELRKLRGVKALPKWLIQTSYHKALLVQRRGERQTSIDEENIAEEIASSPVPVDTLIEVEREQAVRDAVRSLPERCQRLVRMLFYEDPPRDYQSVARELSLAPGSIGFIRGRCLQKLRKELSKIGPS